MTILPPAPEPAGTQWDASIAAALLIAAGEALMESLEYRKTLDTLARLVVSEFPFADWCGVYLRGDDGRFERAWVRHRDPEKEIWSTTYLARPPASNMLVDLGPDIAGGKVLFRPKVDDEFLSAVAQSEEHLAKLRELQIQSLIVAPLRAHAEITGALTLARCSPGGRPFDLRDRATAEDIGRRGGLAVDHARAMGLVQEQKRTIERSLATIAHDFRQPIGTLSNAADLLSHARSDDERAKYLEMIARARTQAVRLADDILVTVKAEAGRDVVIQPTRVSVDGLLRELESSHEVEAGRKGISFEVASAADLPDVLADRDKAMQALNNLVANAIKFTPKSGTVKLDAEAMGDFVRISVADDGPGIAEGDQATIFQPWGRAVESLGPGTGLGLSSAKIIAEAHGGAVTLKSSLGYGSTFSFALPVIPPDTPD